MSAVVPSGLHATRAQQVRDNFRVMTRVTLTEESNKATYSLFFIILSLFQFNFFLISAQFNRNMLNIYTRCLWSFRSVTSCLWVTGRPSALASQWMLHWWRVIGSTVRELFPCTQPSTPSTRLDRPLVPLCESSAWPAR